VSLRDPRPVLLLTSPDCLRHDPGPVHPERPDRLRAVLDALERHGLGEALQRPEVVPVDRALLEAVHDPGYVRLVERAVAAGGGPLDPDTVVGPGSLEAALAAAAAAVQGAEAVARGDARAAFAAVRPPGHHARPAAAMGFCLFNNAALAAVAARDRAGARRIFLVDWDVHHGNGTQECFEGDPTVLYVSLHQEGWYPGTGMWDEVGSGHGEGFTLNVPLPPGTGDEGYALVFEEVVVPLARAFAPDLVLLSAGYDPHHADPLGGMVMTAPGFRRLATLLLEAASGSRGVAAVLEGGYALEALGASVVATVEALTGRAADPPIPAERPPELPYAVIRERVRRARSVALNYWRI
jgi:acetoin utilization deacetylase AcuC-like enzyme